MDSSNWLRANLTRSCTVTFKEAIRPCQNYLCYPVHHLFTVIHHDFPPLPLRLRVLVCGTSSRSARSSRRAFLQLFLVRGRGGRGGGGCRARCSRLWPRSAIGQASSRFRKVPQRYFQQTGTREALRPVTSRHQRLLLRICQALAQQSYGSREPAAAPGPTCCWLGGPSGDCSEERTMPSPSAERPKMMGQRTAMRKSSTPGEPGQTLFASGDCAAFVWRPATAFCRPPSASWRPAPTPFGWLLAIRASCSCGSHREAGTAVLDAGKDCFSPREALNFLGRG